MLLSFPGSHSAAFNFSFCTTNPSMCAPRASQPFPFAIFPVIHHVILCHCIYAPGITSSCGMIKWIASSFYREQERQRKTSTRIIHSDKSSKFWVHFPKESIQRKYPHRVFNAVSRSSAGVEKAPGERDMRECAWDTIPYRKIGNGHKIRAHRCIYELNSQGQVRTPRENI